jgi:hypothetical protein
LLLCLVDSLHVEKLWDRLGYMAVCLEK